METPLAFTTDSKVRAALHICKIGSGNKRVHFKVKYKHAADIQLLSYKLTTDCI